MRAHIDSRGKGDILKEYENDLKKIQEYLTKKGGKITITDDDVTFYIQDGRLEIGSGVGRYTSDYTNLQKEKSVIIILIQ